MILLDTSVIIAFFKLGKPTGEMDALIAATAMAHKAVLITGNRKHFENIEGLKVEVWPTK